MPRFVWYILITVLLAVGGVFARYAIIEGAIFTSEVAGKDGVSAELKKREFYRAAAETVSLNQDVLTSVGEPMTFGNVALNRDADDLVSVDLELKGPNGVGHAVVDVLKPTKTRNWQVKSGDFFPAKGPPIHIRAR